MHTARCASASPPERTVVRVVNSLVKGRVVMNSLAIVFEADLMLIVRDAHIVCILPAARLPAHPSAQLCG